MDKYPLYESTMIFLQICGCVNKCRHCYIPEKNSKSKTIEEVKNIIDNYAKVKEFPPLTINPYLYFHNEPTIHSQIISIVEYMISKGIKYPSALSTNGFGIVNRKDGKEILSAFKKIGTKKLHLTLFGEREYHDWFVGRCGAFDTVIEASKIGKAMEFNIVWTLFLTKDNANELVKIATQLKDDQVEIGIFGHSQRVVGKTKRQLHPTSNSLNRVKNLLKVPNDGASVVKTEKEWVEMCISNEDMSPYLCKEENERNPWLIEYDWELYESTWRRADFRIGNLRTDELREVFLEKLGSKGSKKYYELNIPWVAKQYGNPNNTQVYYFWDLLFRWFLKIYPNPDY